MDMNNILRGLEEYTQSHLIKGLRRVIQKFPEQQFQDCVSRNQVASKVWLLQEVHKAFGSDYKFIYILCGWYGVLAAMLNDHSSIQFAGIRSIDLDASCERIADEFNYELFKDKWKFKAFTGDILNYNYDQINVSAIKDDGKEAQLCENIDLLINTSCEHLDNFSEWRSLLPSGIKVALQSNDFEFHAQHTNCCSSLTEFQDQCQLSKVIYAGEKRFDDYNRFMVVGIT